MTRAQTRSSNSEPFVGSPALSKDSPWSTYTAVSKVEDGGDMAGDKNAPSDDLIVSVIRYILSIDMTDPKNLRPGARGVTPSAGELCHEVAKKG